MVRSSIALCAMIGVSVFGTLCVASIPTPTAGHSALMHLRGGFVDAKGGSGKAVRKVTSRKCRSGCSG